MSTGTVAVPGFVDSHAHLLKDSAGLAFPSTAASVREFHHQVASHLLGTANAETGDNVHDAKPFGN